MSATEVGYFEDFEDDEVLEVGIAGVDESGGQRSVSIQRSTYEPDEQEKQAGMDSYCVSTERGFTAYGCLRRVELAGSRLTLRFVAEDAEILEISSSVVVDLSEAAVEAGVLSNKLRDILEWGPAARQPALVGLGARR